MYINRNLTLPEIFANVEKKQTINEKVELLRLYDTKVIRWYVDNLYNRDLSSISIPDYTPSKSPAGIAFMNIGNAIPRLNSIFNHMDNKPMVERNLTLVLENVTKEEAVLIVKLIKGERRIQGVSKTVFKKVYPEFFRTEEETKTNKA